jgi:hypothetical protein
MSHFVVGAHRATATAAPPTDDDLNPLLNADVQRVGLFFWKGPLCRKKIFRLQKMVTYFTVARIKAILLPIINKEGTLSLRALDWLVTNYAKKKPIIYNVTPPDCPEVVVNMYRSYKSWLWNHKRKNFDPFRRGQRIFFTLDRRVYESTVGQLNFFFWASRYGVLDYAGQHIKEIEKDQAMSTKKVPLPGENPESPRVWVGDASHSCASSGTVAPGTAATGTGTGTGTPSTGTTTTILKKRKRRQLSQPPRECVFVFPTTIRVVFNPELK